MLDQNIVQGVEKDLLLEILRRLQEQRMTEEQAQELAKEFLSLLPFEDQRDLLAKLSELSKTNVEVNNVYLKYAAPVEEEERQKKLSRISEHIQNGKIDEALAVAKGGPIHA